MKKLLFIIIPLAAALILAGCSKNHSNQDSDAPGNIATDFSDKESNSAKSDNITQPNSPAASDNPTAQSNSGIISADKAKSIAFERAGVTEADVRDLDIDLERSRYEIDFEATGNEYEVEINATTGEIIWFESKPDRY